MAGKGDSTRPTNMKIYRSHFDRIDWKKKKKKNKNPSFS